MSFVSWHAMKISLSRFWKNWAEKPSPVFEAVVANHRGTVLLSG